MSPSTPRLDGRLRERLVQHLGAFERRALPEDGRRRAAVALALVEDQEERPCFLLTRRAPRMRAHAGQWALPGGSIDAGENARTAALRELHEELGLVVDPDEVLGLLDDYPTRSGFVITPVVMWAGAQPVLVPNPKEVASAHCVPLADLGRPEVPKLRRIPESDRPVISIPLLGTDIHAPTAAILYQLAEVAFRGRATRVAHLEQPVWAWR